MLEAVRVCGMAVDAFRGLPEYIGGKHADEQRGPDRTRDLVAGREDRARVGHRIVGQRLKHHILVGHVDERVADNHN